MHVTCNASIAYRVRWPTVSMPRAAWLIYSSTSTIRRASSTPVGFTAGVSCWRGGFRSTRWWPRCSSSGYRSLPVRSSSEAATGSTSHSRGWGGWAGRRYRGLNPKRSCAASSGFQWQHCANGCKPNCCICRLTTTAVRRSKHASAPASTGKGCCGGSCCGPPEPGSMRYTPALTFCRICRKANRPRPMHTSAPNSPTMRIFRCLRERCLPENPYPR